MQRVKIVEPQPDVEALCMTVGELVKWQGCLGIQAGTHRHMLILTNKGDSTRYSFSRPRWNFVNYTYSSAESLVELLELLPESTELYRFEAEAELLIWMAVPYEEVRG